MEKFLDLAKENGKILLIGENGNGNTEIFCTGTKEATRGMFEEYIVRRWVCEFE